MKKNYTFNGYNNKVDLSDLDEEITFVEKGSPCGELLRRYWLPVILSEELGELPKLVKILGEARAVGMSEIAGAFMKAPLRARSTIASYCYLTDCVVEAAYNAGNKHDGSSNTLLPTALGTF